ncbi:MAG: class II aldolase/adducin family protein [Deltaproteobacteria bacterium]|nr:class II aldolase/adducin family protein [Deltaproteobacteria bacterium]
MIKQSQAEQLAAISNQIYRKQLTTSSGGNLSIRDECGGLWITPKKIDKGCLLPEHMVHIAADGSFNSVYSPTSEWPFHSAVMQTRPDICALVHAHPISLVAFAITRTKLPLNQFPLLRCYVGKLGYIAYATPGSKKLSKIVAQEFATGCDMVILENHGVITSGTNLNEAYNRLRALEHLAEIYIAATRLGNLEYLTVRLMAQALSMQMPQKFESVSCDISSQYIKRQELLAYLQRAESRGLLGSPGGTISSRCDNGFLIASEGMDIDGMQPNDLVYITSDGCQLNKIPHATVELHKKIYELHPNINAIAIVLPVNLMAFAATNTAYEIHTNPESFIILKSITNLSFDEGFDNTRIANAISEDRPIALIKNSSAVVCGNSPFMVLDRLEVAETVAATLIQAKVIGDITRLSQADLIEISKTYG